MAAKSVQCDGWYDVPNPDPTVVRERQRCKKRTTHESHLCPQHRGKKE